MLAIRNFSSLVLFATFLLGVTFVGAEDQYNDDAQQYDYDNYDNNYNNYMDDAAQENGDDAVEEYYDDNIYSNSDYSAGDDVVTYWTDYAVLPKRCIT